MLAPLNYEADSTAPKTFSLNRRYQTHYRQPLWSGCTHPSGDPSPWVGPYAVWGDTDTAVWGSWRHRSRCPSNPSAARTWGSVGPGSMMSSAGRLGPVGLSGKYPNLQHLWGKRRGRSERNSHDSLLFFLVLFVQKETSNITGYRKHCNLKENWLGESGLQGFLEFLNLHILALLGFHIGPRLFTKVGIYICFTTCQDHNNWH